MDYARYPHHRGLPASHEGERQARFLDDLGAPSLHRKNPNGSVSSKVNGRLYVKKGPEDDPLKSTFLSKLAWMPEGMVITPRTAEAPKGWGLPPTEDGFGTPGGDFPYVVISRYRHSNTPEYLHSVYSDPPEMTGDTLSMNLNWPLLHLETAEVGSWQSGRFLGQFLGRWIPLLKEKKQPGWFAHRPSVRAWPFSMMPAIMEGVNERRAEFDRHPVSPPLNGWTADLAQAICLENVRAKLVEHESPSFRQGWRTLDERVYARAGQPEIAGENLYASYGMAQGEVLGNETVLAWKNSAEHDAVMRFDYTEGLRASRESAGTAQLTGEVMSLGTWTRANLGLPNRAKEVTAVLMSASGRGPRCTTWRHPIYGAMSVSTTPGTFAMLQTRNVQWAEVESASFHHTDIEVVKNSTEDFLAQREHLLGAGICSIEVSEPLSTSAWDLLLKEKRRREAAYARRLQKANLPADDACEDSEADLDRMMTGAELRLRTLSYEESGPAHASPSSGTVCRLVLRQGKAEDFLATREVIASFTVPFNPCTMPLACRFSEDGRKAVVALGEYRDDVSGRWAGEKLHFYEFADDVVTEVGTSEITIEVADSGFTQTANGRCHLYPYYDRDALKFVDMEVDHSDSNATLDRVLSAKLILPDETQWVYISTVHGISGGITGVVRHLLYLDPLLPERTHWIEYTLTEDGAYTNCTASIRRNMLAPEMVKTLYEDVTVSTATGGNPWLTPLFADKTNVSPASWVYTVHPAWPHGSMPESNFKASFYLGAVGMVRPAGAPYRFGAAGSPKSTPLAPTWFTEVAGYGDTLSDASTPDAYVLAGQLNFQPFGIGLPGAPGGAWTYFKSSSLDLEAITGIEGMSDNLLPVWSI